MFDASCQLEGMILSQKEVHIVELDGVCAILRDQVAKDRGSALRRFHALLIAVGGMDAAEAAIEGASDAGVMDCGAFAKEGWSEIFFDGHGMARRPGRFAGDFPVG